MKKFVLIPDSFKGTMSSLEVCRIMEESIRRHFPQAEVLSLPVADGGEGRVEEEGGGDAAEDAEGEEELVVFCGCSPSLEVLLMPARTYEGEGADTCGETCEDEG